MEGTAAGVPRGPTPARASVVAALPEAGVFELGRYGSRWLFSNRRLTAVTIRTPSSRLAHSSVRTVFRKLVMWAAWITVSPGTKDGFGHAASV